MRTETKFYCSYHFSAEVWNHKIMQKLHFREDYVEVIQMIGLIGLIEVIEVIAVI